MSAPAHPLHLSSKSYSHMDELKGSGHTKRTFLL
jgi:hypothetical protein